MATFKRIRDCASMATFCRHRNFQSALASRPQRLLQMRLMSAPRIRAKPDRLLDEVTERDKLLRPFFRIIDILSGFEGLAVKLRRLENLQWQLGIKNKKLTIAAFLKRYPNIFHVYTHPDDGRIWCECTQEFAALIREEQKIRADSQQAVQTLQRLLMMTGAGRIRVDKLQAVRKIFAFPDDFVDKMIPEHPQFFKLVSFGSYLYVELVEWDDGLALSEFEKKVKQDAAEKGMGDVEVRGKAIPFKILLSPGMALRKKNLEILETWQSLPYISPYEDWTLVKKGTLLSEKRLVALMHEFFCLTIEKKARLKVIEPFRDEFGLSQKIHHLFERFPGIFYTSLRGDIKTIMLREAYEGSELLQDHPLVSFKVKFVEMVNAGPRSQGIKGVKQPTEGPESETEDMHISNSQNESCDGEETSVTEDEESSDFQCSDTDECDHNSSGDRVEALPSKCSA